MLDSAQSTGGREGGKKAAAEGSGGVPWEAVERGWVGGREGYGGNEGGRKGRSKNK